MNAKDVTSGTGAEGHEAATDDLSGQRGAFPAVWWSKSAGEWFHDDPEHGLMAVGAMGSLADSLPRDAQRLVPVGPLLELVAELEQAAARAYEQAEGVKADGLEGWAGLANGREDCTYVLRGRLASLLGESPDPPARQESQG